MFRFYFFLLFLYVVSMVSKTLLDKYKRKLNYLDKFHKLCRSVQLISLSKVQRSKYRIRDRQASLEIFKLLFNVRLYDNDRRINKYLIFILGTDRTCCNVLNGNLFNRVSEVVDNLLDKNKEINLVTFGNKTKVFFKKHYRELHKKNINNLITEPLTFPLMVAILEQVIYFDSFQSDSFYNYKKEKKHRYRFDKCLIFYNRYSSLTVQIPAVYSLFSFNLLRNIHFNYGIKISTFLFSELIFDPLKYFFLNELILYGYSLVLLDSFEENEICEYAARANVMKHAYNASKDIMKSLRIEYNKIRQELITRELTELVTAADVTNPEF